MRKPRGPVRWVTWDGFAPFWQSLVGGVLRVSQEYAVSMRTRVLDKEALFVFRVRDKDDRPVAGLSPTSQWLQSDYAGGKAVRWTQSRPGEYEASVPRAEATALKPLLLSLDGPGGQAVRYCAYLPEPPRTEADETGPDLAAAQAIAEAGRGIVAADVESLARFCGVPRMRDFTIRKPLWPWLIAAAVLLWPIDIVVRRSLA